MTTYKKCGKLNLINDNMMVRDRIESECRDLFKRYKIELQFDYFRKWNINWKNILMVFLMIQDKN